METQNIPPYTATYNQQNFVPNNYTPNTYNAVMPIQRPIHAPSDYKLLAIITCFVNFIFGIPALIYSNKSKNALQGQNVNDARKKGNISLGLSLTGIIITIAAICVGIPSLYYSIQSSNEYNFGNFNTSFYYGIVSLSISLTGMCFTAILCSAF
ncbi:hypothetical protein A3Q56_05986, partial [Intoshia linei]